MSKDSSFLEKLKKGMGVEIPEEKKEIEEKEAKEIRHPLRQPADGGAEKKEKVKKKEEKEKKEEKKKIAPKLEMKTAPLEEKKVKKIEIAPPSKESKKEEGWFEAEGKLAIDVYQTEDELVIQSAVAGVKVEDLNILMEGDLISIRGRREKPLNEKGDYFTQECYWGPFSREIILPVEVDPNRIEALMKEGILTIRIPKILREKKRKVQVKKLT